MAPEGGPQSPSPADVGSDGRAALLSALAHLRAREGDSGAAETSAVPRPRYFHDVARHSAAVDVHTRITGEPGWPQRQPDVDIPVLGSLGTERGCQVALTLCVDASSSMVRSGRWVQAQRSALAMHYLAETRLRPGALQLVIFGRHAQAVDAATVAAIRSPAQQARNMHHALQLAQRHAQRARGAQPVVFLVTDGAPTAHRESDGSLVSRSTPLARTLAVTVAQADQLSRMGARLSVFMLGEDEWLAEFADVLVCHADVHLLAPTACGLGTDVLGEFLRSVSWRR